MAEPAPTAEMLSTGQVGRALGVSINTVKSWVRAGKIDAIRLPSGHLRIPRGELERLLRGSSPPAGSGRWEAYERWRRDTRAEELDMDRALEWLDAVLRLSRGQGPLLEDSLEEKGERVRRMHRALAGLRR